METDNILSKELKEKLEYLRQGYPANQQSFGSLEVITSNPKMFLGTQLNREDLEQLGRLKTYIKNEDFEGSLFSTITSLFLLNGIKIPTIDNFNHFQIEYDYIRNIVENTSKKGLILEPETLKNINLIKKNPENNSFKDKSQRNIDLYTLDINENIKKGKTIKNIKGKLIARKKTHSSAVLKYIQEYINIRFPSKEVLDKLGMYDSKHKFSYWQRSYYDKCMKYTYGALNSGDDVYKYFSNEIENVNSKNNDIELDIIKTAMNLFFVDYIAFKWVSDKQTIKEFNKILMNKKDNFMKRLEYRTKDYLNQGIKDMSIVHALNGMRDRSSLEVRLQPLSQYMNGELGIKAHPEYKLKTEKQVSDYLILEMKELGPIFSNLSISYGLNPSQVLGQFAKNIPRNDIFDEHFNYDDNSRLYLIK